MSEHPSPPPETPQLPSYIHQNLNPTCAQKITGKGNGTIKKGDPYPFGLRLASRTNLTNGTTSTIFNSSSDSFSAKLHPLTILESPVPDPARLSTFIPQLLTASYPVGGQGDSYISSNPTFSHTLYRYLVSSDPKVKSLLLSTINNNLLAHHDELITIALEYGCSQEQARELIDNIIVDINPHTTKIVTYSAPDTPFNENVADRRGHKDDSSWRSVFVHHQDTKLVRR